jgi:urease accessory protein
MNAISKTLVATITAAAPMAVMAHAGHESTSGFMAGVTHPVMGLDHLLAMIAAGFVAARFGMKGIATISATFAFAMLAGFLMALSGLALPVVELGITGSVAVFGALIVVSRFLPNALSALIVAAFALFHGFAHGLEVPASASAMSFAVGFMIAVFAVTAMAGLLREALEKSLSKRTNSRAEGISALAFVAAGAALTGM